MVPPPHPAAPTEPSSGARPRRWKAYALRLGALAFGFCLALVGLEVFLRSADILPFHQNPISGFHEHHPRLGWLGVPGAHARFRQPDFDTAIEIDERGFRRRGAPFEGVENSAPRIAFLGDSFTWGWGVGQGESFTDRLQELLGNTAHVQNFGVSGYSTGQERLLLEELVLPSKPEVVVVMFYGNDLRDNGDANGGRRPWFSFEQQRLEGHNIPVRRKVSALSRSLGERSRAISFLWNTGNTLIAGLAEERARKRELGQVDLEELEGKWSLVSAILAEMKDLCQKADTPIELRVVHIPRSGRVASTVEPGAVQTGYDEVEKLRVICAALELPYLDLTPGLRRAWEEHPEAGPVGQPFYLTKDPHWNVAGHHQAAETLHASWDWPSSGGARN